MRKKRILLIATGGTISSQPKGERGGLTPVFDAERLLQFASWPLEKVSVKGETLFQLDSTNIHPVNVVAIGQAVANNYKDYDGFVVTHGTDTLTYTAALLSYTLRNLKKPIIITGSQIPIGEEGSDGRENLSNAILSAASDNLRGVLVLFYQKIIAGTRAVKIHTKGLDAFDSINAPLVGRVENSTISLSSWGREVFAPKEEPFHFSPAIDTRVLSIKLFPGIDSSLFTNLESRYRGVVIESFGLGGVPDAIGYHLVDQIRTMAEKGMTVVLTTQCLRDGIDLTLYEVGRKLAGSDIVAGGVQSADALIMKLMVALGSYPRFEDQKRFIESSIGGDS